MMPSFGRMVLLLAVLFVGCQSEPQTAEARALARKHSLPSSNGTHNELTLFCDRALWDADLGVILLEQLAKPMDGLPMAEPHFDLSRIDQDATSSLTKRSKSILTLAIIPDSSSTLVLKNLWAEPQLVVAIIAPSQEALIQRVKASLPEVIARFDAQDADLPVAPEMPTVDVGNDEEEMIWLLLTLYKSCLANDCVEARLLNRVVDVCHFSRRVFL